MRLLEIIDEDLRDFVDAVSKMKVRVAKIAEEIGGKERFALIAAVNAMDAFIVLTEGDEASAQVSAKTVKTAIDSAVKDESELIKKPKKDKAPVDQVKGMDGGGEPDFKPFDPPPSDEQPHSDIPPDQKEKVKIELPPEEVPDEDDEQTKMKDKKGGVGSVKHKMTSKD